MIFGINFCESYLGIWSVCLNYLKCVYAEIARNLSEAFT